MKKLLSMLVLMLAVVCIFTACNSKPGTSTDKEDVITVEDGYLVVNGKKTEHKVHTEPSISVIDGYVAVNGVKTEYKVELECSHAWQTVTTPPTCTEDGYDIMTCSVCEKKIKTNEVKGGHKFNSTYTIDDNYHWYSCSICDAVKNKELHTLDDEGVCTVCKLPVSSTPGVVYDISADGTYAEVIEYNGTATKVKIAEEYNGLPVMVIYEGAFGANEIITSVIIPNSITSIGEYAFAYCTSLTSVVIPDSITSIGERAFSNCSSLTSVVIPDSVTTIDYGAFEYCNSLTSVVIGNGVTSICSAMFSDCTSLTSIVIPDSVTTIDIYAFSDCFSLTSVVIGDGVTSIGDGAFDDCSSLTSVVIGDGVTSISGSAFSGCSLLFNEHENCKYLGSKDNPYFALIKVTTNNFSSYTIHEDTKIIASPAFAHCSRLTSIVIPDGVTSIDGSAFSNCSSLTSVVIPDSVTSIGYRAFYDCSKLKDVYYTGSESEWAEIIIGSYNADLTSATIHYNYVPKN